MKIKYLGPGSSVNVVPYGRHEKGEIKEYPDDSGIDLIATSKKQKFEVMEEPAAAGDKPSGDNTSATAKEKKGKK